MARMKRLLFRFNPVFRPWRLLRSDQASGGLGFQLCTVAIGCFFILPVALVSSVSEAQDETFERYLPGASRFQQLRTQRASGEPYDVHPWRLNVGTGDTDLFVSDTEDGVFVMRLMHSRWRDYYRVELCNGSGQLKQFGYIECPMGMTPVTVVRVRAEELPDGLTHGVGVVKSPWLHTVDRAAFTFRRPFPTAPDILIVPIDWHDANARRPINVQYEEGIFSRLEGLVVEPLDFYGITHLPPVRESVDVSTLDPAQQELWRRIHEDPDGLQVTISIGAAEDEPTAAHEFTLEFDLYVDASRWPSVLDDFGRLTRSLWREPMGEEWVLVRQVFKLGSWPELPDLALGLQEARFWTNDGESETEESNQGLTLVLRHRAVDGEVVRASQYFSTLEASRLAIYSLTRNRTWWTHPRSQYPVLLELLDRLERRVNVPEADDPVE